MKFRIPKIGEKIFEIPGDQILATVIKRDNRFLCSVMLDGETKLAHLHDPGRLKELIYPGNSVLVRNSKGKKTDLSITAAKRGEDWILTDSRFHNRLASLFLEGERRPEVPINGSRLDFMVDGAYVEVKGCSMIDGDVATFPDAPTLRGKHHLEILTDLLRNGTESALIILVFSHEARCFSPNYETDPGFGIAFQNFMGCGGRILIPKFRLAGPFLQFHGLIRPCVSEKF